MKDNICRYLKKYLLKVSGIIKSLSRANTSAHIFISIIAPAFVANIVVAAVVVARVATYCC